MTKNNSSNSDQVLEKFLKLSPEKQKEILNQIMPKSLEEQTKDVINNLSDEEYNNLSKLIKE